MAISGRGKQIKSDKLGIRAQRINRCLNKAIRVAFDIPSKGAMKRVKHWQKILINFYDKEW
jgi:hypothetical protein